MTGMKGTLDRAGHADGVFTRPVPQHLREPSSCRVSR